MPHDTRKSDVWSLGVTFFEILIGRTPFENAEGEQFTTKEDLEKYWGRTVRERLPTKRDSVGFRILLNKYGVSSSAASGSARGRCPKAQRRCSGG